MIKKWNYAWDTFIVWGKNLWISWIVLDLIERTPRRRL